MYELLRWVVVIATVLFFRRAGKLADSGRANGHAGVAWSLASLALWLVGAYVLRWGLLGGLLLQGGLLVLLPVRRTALAVRARSRGLR